MCEIEKYEQGLSESSFMVLVGKLKIVTDRQERARAIAGMVETTKEKHMSPNFLQAYGSSKRGKKVCFI